MRKLAAVDVAVITEANLAAVFGRVGDEFEGQELAACRVKNSL